MTTPSKKRLTTEMMLSNVDCRTLDISEFDLEALEPGVRWHLRWHVADDGMGVPVRSPLVVIRGRMPGPVLCVTAALHGNEVNGVPVIHRLLSNIVPSRLRGTIIACPVLNVPGMLDRTREFNDGTDMNKVMPGAPTGTGAQQWAHRFLTEFVGKADYLVDLHTASFGRINSLYVRANLKNPVTARMALLQRPRIILHNPPSDLTLRGAASERGIPAITVEVGDPHRIQPRHIRPTVAGIRAVMYDFDMVARRASEPRQAPIICESSRWLYADRGGFLNVIPDITERVMAGQLVATQVDAFGTLVREYRAPTDGIIIGRSVEPVAATGARILHLGHVVTNDEAAQLYGTIFAQSSS